ncbi:MAG: hypothetical protein R2710_05595 [Acidimicrobiales bacterium]
MADQQRTSTRRTEWIGARACAGHGRRGDRRAATGGRARPIEPDSSAPDRPTWSSRPSTKRSATSPEALESNAPRLAGLQDDVDPRRADPGFGEMVLDVPKGMMPPRSPGRRGTFAVALEFRRLPALAERVDRAIVVGTWWTPTPRPPGRRRPVDRPHAGGSTRWRFRLRWCREPRRPMDVVSDRRQSLRRSTVTDETINDRRPTRRADASSSRHGDRRSLVDLDVVVGEAPW